MVNIGGFLFNWGVMTYVMGIVNATPNSFSGDGLTDISEIMSRVNGMIRDKADIIDVGGESTAPTSGAVSEEDELKRVIPVIRELKLAFDVPISIDTMKPAVAEEALKLGVNIINDVSGLSNCKDMAALASDYSAGFIITSNQRKKVIKRDIVHEVKDDLSKMIDICISAGIDKERIICDPGCGFGKSVEQNIELVKRLSEIKALGFPVLLGISNKSFIGEMLGCDVSERNEGNQVMHTIGISQGADIIRVHDVKSAVRTCIMADAVYRDAYED